MSTINAGSPRIVSRAEWLELRKALLTKEKEHTRLGDQLSAEKRRLPWVKVEKDYVFDGPNGKETLASLFGNKTQLLAHHFMFGPDWEQGCPTMLDSGFGTMAGMKNRRRCPKPGNPFVELIENQVMDRSERPVRKRRYNYANSAVLHSRRPFGSPRGFKG
jgi:Bacterial protein of unknown function (DUF899)